MHPHPRVVDGALNVLAHVVLVALVLAVPVLVGSVAGSILAGNPLGLAAFLAVGVPASVYMSRVALAGLWWMHTGRWDWRRTRLRRAIVNGWGAR